MEEKNGCVLLETFGRIEDPRIDRCKCHKLLDILAVTVCAAICGADTWVAVAQFGRDKEEWLRTFLELPNGIPSHDTFGRVFALLDPAAFQDAFRDWVSAIQGRVQGVVAVDGKTARRSHGGADGKKAIHVVSAWADECSLALGQVKTADKSNEITAIPELLRALDLAGCLVTADAMGCQREIARTIVEAGADYLLAVKDNQETLADDVEQEFKQAMAEDFGHMEHQYLETLDKGHGRIEIRQYWYTSDIQGLGTAHRWPGLAGMAMCRATRIVGDQTSVEDRYYITSACGADVGKIAGGIRRHWGIENSLHWVLDVAFDEDQSRIRIGHAAENMAVVRKMALNAIRKCQSGKGGIKTKRLHAGWNNSYLEEVLAAI